MDEDLSGKTRDELAAEVRRLRDGRVCQKLSGGPYSPVVLVAAESFRLTKGTLKHHFAESVAGRRHKRGFCPDCGSRISGGQSEEPSSFIGLTASSMDDPSWYNPRFHIFTFHAQPWDPIDSQATRHEQYAPE